MPNDTPVSRFSQISPPGPQRGRQGGGGRIDVVVRRFVSCDRDQRSTLSLTPPLLCSSGISKQKQSHNSLHLSFPISRRTHPPPLTSSFRLLSYLIESRNHHQLPLDRPYIIPTLLGHWQLVKKDRYPIDDSRLGSPIQGRGCDLIKQTSV